jgi:hypothetical protein
MKRILVLSTLGLMLVGGSALAKGKDPHPNLGATARAIELAGKSLVKAQKANEYDLGGHAAKAEQLLKEAAHEVKEAREAANKHDAEEKKE